MEIVILPPDKSLDARVALREGKKLKKYKDIGKRKHNRGRLKETRARDAAVEAEVSQQPQDGMLNIQCITCYIPQEERDLFDILNQIQVSMH